MSEVEEFPPRETVLQIEKLSVSYGNGEPRVPAVRNVSLQIAKRESYGLVGESGSGKSTLALAVMRYLDPNGRVDSGRILLDGESLVDKDEAEMRKIWGARMGMVYQDPGPALNPALNVGKQIAEVVWAHTGLSERDAWQKALDMLAQVRIADPHDTARRYPHQLSGGMLQRVLIAMSLAVNPEFLVLDEPTTNLDVTTEAVVLDLIMDLKAQYESSILYITHNLGVIARVCDRVGVMYAGELVEEAPVGELFRRPLHPYTYLLLRCVPRLGGDNGSSRRLPNIPGRIPRLENLPSGCIFGPRCPFASRFCREEKPERTELGPGRWTSCHEWERMQKLTPRTSRVDTKVVGTRPGSLEAGSLLRLSEVKKHFPAGRLGSIVGRRRRVVRAVDGISVDLPIGQTLGLVGESGCGKTTLARCIVGLTEVTSGAMEFKGNSIAQKVERRTQHLRKEIQMVFQNPEASLNPFQSVRQTLERPLLLLTGADRAEVRRKVAELLEAVNLDDSYLTRFPSEMSGGEKQRVAIARAIASHPELVLCDEPVSSLDVSVQASILNLLAELQESMGISHVFISHDLAVVRHLCDRVGVLYLGELCELGTAEEVFSSPYHPYTEALLSAVPIPDPQIRQEHIRLEGDVPSAIDIPPGCRFHTRCPRKLGAICERELPPLQEASPSHRIRCHIPLDGLRQVPSIAYREGEDPLPATIEASLFEQEPGIEDKP